MKRAALLLLILVSVSAQLCFAALNPRLFPVHSSHHANVEFWRQIFAKYSIDEAVIHDKYDLSLIYKVVRLADKSAPNARKINQIRLKKAKQSIVITLSHLANGHRPANRQERQMAALFGNNATPERYRSATRNLRIQSGARERFAQGIVRSGRYLQEMQNIFRSHGLPPELTFLPHVESSFNINVHSKYGAAGVWQFIPSTGKLFLNIGETVDERLDPIMATHAAAKLLKKNYTELANWPLAITAYNHGLAGMVRAKAKHRTYSNVLANYQSRSFKFASRNFYSEFIAAYQVASNYAKYFGRLQTDPPNQYHTLRLPGYLPLQTLKERLGLSSKTIYQNNPALKQAVFNGLKYIPKNYLLRLPASVNAARLDYLLPNRIYNHRQKPSIYHIVKKGETASSIARRHGVRLRDFLLANNLDRKARIYPKQKLRIPGNSRRTPNTLARIQTSQKPKS